jgi:hypothetical protein
MEMGIGQHEALREMVHDWCEAEFLPDLSGIPRVLIVKRA